MQWIASTRKPKASDGHDPIAKIEALVPASALTELSARLEKAEAERNALRISHAAVAEDANELEAELRKVRDQLVFVTKEEDVARKRAEATLARLQAPKDGTDALADGWLYHCPDTGTEWSPNHPVESGEVIDAEDVRAATATVLREELLSAWEALDAAEKRAKRQPDALAGSAVGDGALREAAAALLADLDRTLRQDDFRIVEGTNASVKRLRSTLAHPATSARRQTKTDV